MERILLHEHDLEIGVRGEVTPHEDFISRRDFINQTGIFVTPSYFDSIYDDFKEAGVSIEEFVGNYEEKYSNCIVNATMNESFKYEVLDDDLSCPGDYEDVFEPNIWEIIDSLVRTINYEREKKWKQQEKYEDILRQSMAINDERIKLLNGEPEAEVHMLPQ